MALNTVVRAGFSKKVTPKSIKAMKTIWENQWKQGWGRGGEKDADALGWLQGQGGKPLVRAMEAGLAEAHNHCTDFTSHPTPQKKFSRVSRSLDWPQTHNS